MVCWLRYQSQITPLNHSANQEGHQSLSGANVGAVSIRKTVLPGMAIPMLKIRRPTGRLIFNMEMAIGKIETGPRSPGIFKLQDKCIGYMNSHCISKLTIKTNMQQAKSDLITATSLVISNWIQIVNFSTRVTVKFDGWPKKKIGHLFYATSSFVQHSLAIGEFKLELQSGKAKSGSNSTIFRAMRLWNLTDDLAKQ